MAKKVTACAILAIASLQGTKAQSKNSKALHIGVVYPVSNHGTSASGYSNVVSFHLLGGLSRNENGFSLSGISNVVTSEARGVQIAGFSNHIHNKASGLQLSGFINTYKQAEGIQVAGFANWAQAQVKGAQVSGFVNKAGNVSGAQVAGFLNRAKSVKGIQLSGFLNIADSSDYPVGLINIIKSGEKSIGISADENKTTLLSFRSGGRVLYGIVGAGYSFENEKDQYVLEAGLGAHLKITRAFRVNTEAAIVHYEDFEKGTNIKYALRLLPALQLVPRMELFAGPTLNMVHTNTEEGKKQSNHYLWEKSTIDNFKALYFGGLAGIHLKL